ncbi:MULTISPECIES: biotin--[acetyl-CoA-carboxylase] ligase [Rhodomicrobium]|uniref:biotin--[acetyl-CoA-carboxylase] ligase n=1 Tax=Rhodomicrobium TaxID=1068 RepID=UPI000B4A5F32|nr:MULTISPECIES: biotin--[acetyl-CoA-carboxylase] ligase [Rhodomicrobium]
MAHGGIDLPTGYRLVFHETIDSTNAEALRQAGQGDPGGVWIWAGAQGAGRGRSGRGWTSPEGNLYASLLIRPRVPLVTALQLSLLAGVAAYDAIGAVAAGSGLRPALRLKWPNDILLDGGKLGGILLESAASPATDAAAIVIGTGLNLAEAPGNLGRAVASLAAAGIDATPAQTFAALAWTTAEWIARWRDGQNFHEIREAWLERAKPLGGPISVNLGGTRLTGSFLGIDEAGALRLALASGEEKRITAGDVAIGIEA